MQLVSMVRVALSQQIKQNRDFCRVEFFVVRVPWTRAVLCSSNSFRNQTISKQAHTKYFCADCNGCVVRLSSSRTAHTEPLIGLGFQGNPDNNIVFVFQVMEAVRSKPKLQFYFSKCDCLKFWKETAGNSRFIRKRSKCQTVPNFSAFGLIPILILEG